MHRLWLAALVLLAGGAGAAPPSQADPARGEAVYARCLGCHALAQDRTGPHHCGLFGRKAGTVADFPYSPAMKRSRIVWNSTTLDRFLENPMRTVPGTSMGYDGVKDPGERAALIAWLREAGRAPACATPR